MVQRSEDFSFPLEASQTIRVSGKRPRENFEGDFALQTSVAGAIHLSHPTGA
jgi:hypothetical protein